ncbi:MAG: hypothetical protein Q4A75_08660 [Peptostreptococcaceae bacterium]|nr:hypothetical protein [Peptostreptococcaceae bacterium]
MYKILGYLSSALLGLLFAPYLLRVINKKFLNDDPKIKSVVRSLKKIHPIVGLTFAVISLFHGYSALGGFRLHTGSLVYGMAVIAIIFGAMFSVKKKKQYLIMHKSFTAMTFILWTVHILFPSALYYLFN